LVLDPPTTEITVKVDGWALIMHPEQWAGYDRDLIRGLLTKAQCEGIKIKFGYAGTHKFDLTTECLERTSGKLLAAGHWSKVVTAAPPPETEPPAGPGDGSGSDDDKLGGGAVAGIVIAVAVVVAIVAAIVTYMVVKKKNRVNQDVEASA
jgi:hypothetical protein